MFEVLVQMTGLIVCGIGWRLFKPAGLEPVQTRKVLTSLVYYLLLPALVLSVLWQAELGKLTFLIAISAALAVVLGMSLSALTCRACKSGSPVAGAVILAAAFPNATYLGLPVLEAAFGPWARGVAIQYDLFACTPLLFTAGILLASRYGDTQEVARNMAGELLRIPAVLAAILAVILNLMEVPSHNVIDGLLGLLERGVVPLMLFSLGLSLEWSRAHWHNLPAVIPVVLLRLFIVPAIILVFASAIGLTGEWKAAVVLETAMPSMVLGIVFCDRYNLDVSIYAAAVTITTVLSLLTLPMWFQILT